MEILINDTRTISEVQLEFSKEFPFLKIEFFDAPHKIEKALPKSKMFSHEKKIGSIRKLHKNGKLKVTKSETVNTLENDLWNNYGLSAQIFRKSGNLWIETSLTDNWTLEQQNREGFEMSNNNRSAYKDAEEKDFTDRDKWE